MLWLYHSNETLPRELLYVTIYSGEFQGTFDDLFLCPLLGLPKFKFDVLGVKVFIMRVRCRFRAGRCYGKVEVKCDIDFLAQSRTLKILLNDINTYQTVRTKTITKRSRYGKYLLFVHRLIAFKRQSLCACDLGSWD